MSLRAAEVRSAILTGGGAELLHDPLILSKFNIKNGLITSEEHEECSQTTSDSDLFKTPSSPIQVIPQKHLN